MFENINTQTELDNVVNEKMVQLGVVLSDDLPWDEAADVLEEAGQEEAAKILRAAEARWFELN